jgi:opacity protein-like surface antigen
MRKTLGIAFMLFVFATLAAAQVPTSGNVFFGYSFYNTDLSSIDRANTNGWEGSLEGKVLPFVGIVADFSGHYGSQNFPAACPVSIPNCNASINFNFSEHNVLFGPRVSASVGKFRPFAEAMVGAGHVNVNGAGSDTSFATALGGGLDYKLFHLLAWRFEGDYVQTRFFGATQNNVRLSTGIVLRF